MSKKLLIIGLDGAEFSIINPLIEQGVLPNIAKLIQSGSHGPLTTTVPPLTPCAWSSFMTGKNPGKHGVYDFHYLDADKEINMFDSNKRKDLDLWQILSNNDLKSVVFNVPMTYPAYEINGSMVTDFTTPTLSSAFTYPASLKSELLNQFPNYKISEKTKFSQSKNEQTAFADEIFELIQLRRQVFDWLLKKNEWDFGMVVFGASDHISHWYWEQQSNPKSKFQNAVKDVYIKLDEAVGALQEKYPKANVIIMSDHGFGEYKKDVNLNLWLIQNGYLQLKEQKQASIKSVLSKFGISVSDLIQFALKLGAGSILNSLPMHVKKKLISTVTLTYTDIDWSKTQAYSYGYYGPIYLNNKIVKPEDKEKLVVEIKSNLLKIKDPEGKPLINKIWLKEEIYVGPKMNSLPEIIFSMQDYSYGCSSIFAFSSNELFSTPKTLKTGDHRQDGVFIASGPDFLSNEKPLENAQITDITPTVLELYNLTVPEDMDGRVLKEILKNKS